VRILVVDSDERVREILVQRLRARRYDADGAQTAGEAFDLLSSAIYDVILLDVIMPRNAALDVMRMLRGLAFPPRCIVMSGVADLWKRANPEIQVAGVLQKPFAFEDLLRLIA
jgi:DNA-binding response OmpR family regulator